MVYCTHVDDKDDPRCKWQLEEIKGMRNTFLIKSTMEFYNEQTGQKKNGYLVRDQSGWITLKTDFDVQKEGAWEFI